MLCIEMRANLEMINHMFDWIISSLNKIYYKYYVMHAMMPVVYYNPSIVE